MEIHTIVTDSHYNVIYSMYLNSVHFRYQPGNDAIVVLSNLMSVWDFAPHIIIYHANHYYNTRHYWTGIS